MSRYCEYERLGSAFICIVLGSLKRLQRQEVDSQLYFESGVLDCGVPDSAFVYVTGLQDLDVSCWVGCEVITAALGNLSALIEVHVGELSVLDGFAAPFGGLMLLIVLGLYESPCVDVPELLAKLVHLTGLQSIRFRHCGGLSNNSATTLAESFSSFSSLQAVDLELRDMGEGGACILGDGLGQVLSVRTVVLGFSSSIEVRYK